MRGSRGRGRSEQGRTEQTFLIPVSGRHEAVLPIGDEEVASLIGSALEDLTDLPFGNGSRMWMSRSKQRDHDAPINRPASHALRLNGLDVAIRGPVVVHHAAITAQA
jgi:hypothetical protein